MRWPDPKNWSTDSMSGLNQSDPHRLAKCRITCDIYVSSRLNHRGISVLWRNSSEKRWIASPTVGVGVHHRHQLAQLLGQHLEVQDLVAVVQLIERHIAGQIRWHALQLSPYPFGLLIQGQHSWREPAGQAQLGALLVSEPDSTIEGW